MNSTEECWFIVGENKEYANISQLNLASNKPTWQANPYEPGNSIFHSSNAVDGLKSDRRGHGGQCAKSADKYRTATWWVNLTGVYSIHDIRIYPRTDNRKWSRRLLGFYVYVSNTTNRRDGYLCFRDTNYTISTIPDVLNITCPVHGQYVIYYNERLSKVKYPDGYSSKAYNDLCEVEVYGCRTGYYGSNCSLLCPYNCRYCHIETGECSWCRPGYQGYQCESVQTEEESYWQFRFYIMFGAFFVAVTANVVLITYICQKGRQRGTTHILTTKEKCNPVKSKPIYENDEGNTNDCYQELTEM
ncbi:uncharacterized protein LOC133203126 [Saccostrea echinata]|uniref:uncharacterized protein LOC133203126 n=1 Tax=Saccostrea echinata TaxID=191078 RepID=UPI002A7FFBA9|nr:uncharacterized protein LOC133203126 [Saccostrea echinata]